VLVTRTRAGETQVFDKLNFHRSGTGTSLAMREFSESLKDALALAGFSRVKIYAEAYTLWIVPAEFWSLPVAARKGPFACSVETMREVVKGWQEMRTRMAKSKWVRIGDKLELI
jgi:hypothetical protein